MVAISPNTSQVFIYRANGEDVTRWEKVDVLDEHHMLVTDIDWHPRTNRILTSGQDRNAYVWTYEEGKWKPTLVILRIGRAATCVKWSPDGQKFACGSGSKQIPICHYEDSQSFWVAKTIKKVKSTVLSVDWSPNNLFLISGGCDFKCRIFSGFIKGVDEKAQDAVYETLWGNQSYEFGAILAEFDQSKGWVEACRFSPSGLRFVFTGHDSTIHFGTINDGGISVATINRRDLPLARVEFLTDDLAVAGGYDNVPVVYQCNGGTWEERGPLDTGNFAAAGGKKKKTAFGSAFSKFDKQSKTGQTGDDGPFLPFRHQNCINGIFARSPTNFTTCCIDGRILFWDANGAY
jgi:actin related protein 2/3 complex subunit 1A/1B